MTETPALRDGSRDFDFFIGLWKVNHHMLRQRLTGCTDWVEFDGTSMAELILGKTANIEHAQMNFETGVKHGIAIRLYDQKTGEWSIYWAATGSTTLDTPMIGSFNAKNGIGEFYDQETHAGRHVYCRFIWSKITPHSCQWEQALSADGGKTWETNWIMEFTRTSD